MLLDTVDPAVGGLTLLPSCVASSARQGHPCTARRQGYQGPQEPWLVFLRSCLTPASGATPASSSPSWGLVTLLASAPAWGSNVSVRHPDPQDLST
jgi:hypothetical protein